MTERVIAGRYRLLRPLGRGGMGAVWLAEDELAGRQVAVKELRAPAGVSDADRDAFMRRALQEARSAARLTHPNAVTLHDIIPPTADDDAVYLIMEFVDGLSLAQLVQRDGPFSEARAASVALQLLSILDAAHGLGIVHRDIKPANVMVGADGQAKLTDFGIAHMVGGTRLTGSGVIGTPAYMAPEQLQGLVITPAVDLWALGVTLYDLVSGRNPFDRDNTQATFYAILMAELPPPPCGPPLATVIGGLLTRDPAQRMTTAQARSLLTGTGGWAGTGSSWSGTGNSWTAPPATRQPATRQPGPGTRAGAPTFATAPAGLSGPHPQTAATRGPGRPGPGRRRRALVIGAVAVVVVGAGAAIAATMLGSGSPGPTAGGKPTVSSIPVASSGPTGSAPGSSGASSTTAAPSDPASTDPASTKPASTKPSSTGAASPTVTLATVPGGFLGSWTGVIDDNTGQQGPQTVQLTLTGGSTGATVGTVNYPHAAVAGCKYNLHLVSASAGRVELYEELESGLCDSLEYVILTRAVGALREEVYAATPAGQSPDFSGRLTRGSRG
jgi:tRNA A-37 threonylcarbamoyl transferase component Bud32